MVLIGLLKNSKNQNFNSLLEEKLKTWEQQQDNSIFLKDWFLIAHLRKKGCVV